jgi:hypothetical protein
LFRREWLKMLSWFDYSQNNAYLKGEERPTMRQMETTLEDVQNSKVHLSFQITRVNKSAINDQSYKEAKPVKELECTPWRRGSTKHLKFQDDFTYMVRCCS